MPSLKFIPSTHTHTCTHYHTIWGPWTNRVKSGHCQQDNPETADRRVTSDIPNIPSGIAKKGVNVKYTATKSCSLTQRPCWLAGPAESWQSSDGLSKWRGTARSNRSGQLLLAPPLSVNRWLISNWTLMSCKLHGVTSRLSKLIRIIISKHFSYGNPNFFKSNPQTNPDTNIKHV